jgi:predicted DNA-binding transcriptional regulator YafY
VRYDIEKSIKNNEHLDMIYMTSDGVISQRKIRVFKVNKDTLQAYCYLRRSNRTFKFENILALIPISMKKGMVG